MVGLVDGILDHCRIPKRSFKTFLKQELAGDPKYAELHRYVARYPRELGGSREWFSIMCSLSYGRAPWTSTINAHQSYPGKDPASKQVLELATQAYLEYIIKWGK